MKRTSCIERLESRIAPSIVFGLRNTNELITFDSAAPTKILTTKMLAAPEAIVAIDVRPATGQLYGLGDASDLFIINPKTGVATQVGSSGAFTLNGTDFGFDFNPVTDLIHVTSDTGQNLRLNPDTGVLVATDTSIAYAASDPHFGGSASVVGSAYTNSFAGATSTTLYDIDYSQDALAVQDPANSGMLHTVGSLGLNATNNVGFDIATGSTTGLAGMIADSWTGFFAGLYSINLTTGAATLIGNIGDGSSITDIAIVPGDLKLVNATTATYRDVDGDTVKIKLTKGTLDPTDFTLMPLGAAGGAQLETLNLGDVGFADTNVTVTVIKAPTGDGQVNIGRINAGTNDMGAVSVPGDLGVLDAGSGTGTAVKSLSVRSMGSYGLSTHGDAGMLESDIMGNLGSLTVSGDVHGAYINVTGSIGPITIGGSLVGGAMDHNGEIAASGNMGAVKIGHDVTGGSGGDTGYLDVTGTLAKLKIGGSLIAGTGPASGYVFVGGDAGPVKIGGDVVGGAGTGGVFADADLASVTIGGSIVGGSSSLGGFVLSNGKIGPVTIGHDVLGGSGTESGFLTAALSLESLTIGGSIVGGSGADSGALTAGDILSSVKIGGSMIGGSGDESGRIFCGSAQSTIKIGHDLQGGAGTKSGAIISQGDLANVTIGGALLGGSKPGGSTSETGEISSLGKMGAIKIGGDFIGASATGTDAVDKSAYIQSGGRIASVSVVGSIVSGIDASTSGAGLTNNTSIRAHDDIGALTVGDSIVGNSSQFVFITARGQMAPSTTKDTAIGAITVGGRVEEARFRAGYDTDLSAANGNASVGAVQIGGDWVASILNAGVKPGIDGVFGTADDEVIDNTSDAIMAKIASIKIKGAVVGTDSGVSDTDHFGFIAQQIGSFKSLGVTAHLTSATDPAIELSPTTGDVTVREV